MIERTPFNWVQTYTGIAFYPLDPKPDEIDIRDIAHALSNTCRFTGHVKKFYSVAEHCIHVATKVSPENALWGLLHDASEAYIQDIARPLKPYLANYKEIEARIMRAVCDRFGLPYEMPQEVHMADRAMCETEFAQLMGKPAQWYGDEPKPYDMALPCYTPEVAEQAFLAYFNVLVGKNTIARIIPRVEVA